MQPLVRLFIVSAVLCVLTVAGSAAEKGVAPLVVQEGMIVSLQYTLTGEDGKVIESNKGKAPLKYIHGKQEMIPGLERALTGMKIGAEKHVIVKPEDGYGLVDFNKLKEIPKDQVPPNGMKVGAELAVKDNQGRLRMFKVHEIRENTVVLDMNHPMAGKTLIFDVKIIDIQPNSAAQPAQPTKPRQPQ
jgi:FKBP-type peptidyl-prolyl cis-trans isomerase SlyD